MRLLWLWKVQSGFVNTSFELSDGTLYKVYSSCRTFHTRGVFGKELMFTNTDWIAKSWWNSKIIYLYNMDWCYMKESRFKYAELDFPIAGQIGALSWSVNLRQPLLRCCVSNVLLLVIPVPPRENNSRTSHNFKLSTWDFANKRSFWF